MIEDTQTVLVTGASSGIGRASAIKLAESGFRVIAAARRKDRLRELTRSFSNITAESVDFSDAQQTKTFCHSIKNLPSPINALVNNAGYSVRGVLEDVSIATIRRLFEVNLFALIQVTQACLPGMRKLRKGTIVNLSSIVGRFSFPGSGVYAASKYAVEGISDALRLELAPFGIKVVVIRPGPIATEFNEVSTQLTGDLMAKTDPDYHTLYQTAGAATGRLFADLPIPGPELIADRIAEVISSGTDEVSISAGPLTEEFLGKRSESDDHAFHDFMLQRFDLKNLQI